jgi:hypothetical protein
MSLSSGVLHSHLSPICISLVSIFTLLSQIQISSLFLKLTRWETQPTHAPAFHTESQVSLLRTSLSFYGASQSEDYRSLKIRMASQIRSSLRATFNLDRSLERVGQG